MDSETRSVTELRERLIEKAITDEAFRARLLADPHAAIKEELGVTVPPGFTVKVHEDLADTSHLVLPPVAYLTEAEMQQAAGGAVRSDRFVW